MKYRLYLLLIVSFLFCSVGDVHAGFVIKKHITSSTVMAATQNNSNNSLTLTNNSEQHSHLYNAIHKLTYPLQGYRRRPSEWVGIVALLSGVLGLFVPGLNFLAILFGVLGMGRNCNTRGLAVAGFVLGILELLFFLIVGGTIVSMILL